MLLLSLQAQTPMTSVPVAQTEDHDAQRMHKLTEFILNAMFVCNTLAEDMHIYIYNINVISEVNLSYLSTLKQE